MHMPTSVLIQDLGAKNTLPSNSLEAASYQGGDMAQEDAVFHSKLTGSNPGKCPLPQIARLASQRLLVTASRGIGDSVIQNTLICNLCC